MTSRFLKNKRNVTISDVAAAASVSKATVSKYLRSDDYYVSERTRQRISKAIAKLEFQPNAVAQALSRQRSHTIGVIVASMANPFYPELISGIEEVTDAAGYTLLLGSSEEQPEKEVGIVESMVRRQVDGLIMASVTMHNSEVSRLIESGMDIVLASRHFRESQIDAAVIDNEHGASLAVKHLLSHGHTRIAHFAGPQNVLPFQLRLKGYRSELESAGYSQDNALVIEAGGGLRAVDRGLQKLLSEPQPPTALFAGNDAIAMSALTACARRRIRVPEDLAIVGFDNVWVDQIPGVRLTSVSSKPRQIGNTAAHLLKRRMNARHSGLERWEAETVTMTPDLVVRHTCGCQDSLESEEFSDASGALFS